MKLTTRMRNTLNSDPKMMMVPVSVTNVKSSILNESEINWLAAELAKEKKAMRICLFESSGDDKLGEQFHSKCDGKGATITVVQSTKGDVFGGFTSRSWDGSKSSKSYSAESSWLFKLQDEGSKVRKRMNIRPEHHGCAVYDRKDWGPCFGLGHDLAVRSAKSYCRWASYSEGVLSDGVTAIHYKLKKMEVFQVADLLQRVD